MYDAAVTNAASTLNALAEDLRQCAYPAAARAAVEAAVAVAAVGAAGLEEAALALEEAAAELEAVRSEGGSQAWRQWLCERIAAAEAAAAASRIVARMWACSSAAAEAAAEALSNDAEALRAYERDAEEWHAQFR